MPQADTRRKRKRCWACYKPYIQYSPLVFACTSTHSNAPVHDVADLYWHMHSTCTAHAWLIATVVSFPGCNLGMRITNLILGKHTPFDKPLQEQLDYRLLNQRSLAFYACVSRTARLWVMKSSRHGDVIYMTCKLLHNRSWVNSPVGMVARKLYSVCLNDVVRLHTSSLVAPNLCRVCLNVRLHTSGFNGSWKLQRVCLNVRLTDEWLHSNNSKNHKWRRRLSVTNYSLENNLPTFRLNAPVVIRPWWRLEHSVKTSASYFPSYSW